MTDHEAGRWCDGLVVSDGFAGLKQLVRNDGSWGWEVVCMDSYNNRLRSFEKTLRNDGSWGWEVERNDVKWYLSQTPPCGVASAEPIVKE
jgi:hypothetical protein